MRDADAPNLSRFVRRLHRRLIVLRLLECAAIGVAGAAALSVLLLPVFIIRAKPALPVVAVLLPLGAVIGASWLLLRRPRVMDAAGEADGQLDLADLLATAWLIARSDRSPDDPFERAVLLSADRRAAALSPSSVVLNRLGARAWTGVGLVSALALTLALLSANPIVLQAGAPRHIARTDATPGAMDNARRSGDPARGSRPMPIVADHPNQEEGGFNPARSTTRATANAADSPTHTETADPTGSGGGTGTSRSKPAAPLANAGSASTPPSRTGLTPGGGGGAASATPTTGNGFSTLSAGATGTARQAPPWATAEWSAAQAAATNAVRFGVVPSQYHDLIRSYFDREGSKP